MQICQKHWDMLRKAVEDRGMSGLVAKNGEEALDNIKEELEGGEPPFDPLMSMNWHWTNAALQCGGLYLMGQKEDGAQYCPICEFEKNMEGFDAESEIGSVADQIRAYCIEQGLIPPAQ